jgi:RNA polymerase sigma-54 factor
MKIGSNIEARVTTTLAMTPRLQQAIRLLQLSVSELSTYLNEQASENPLLIIECSDQSLASPQEGPQEFSIDSDDENPNENLQFEERDPTQQGCTQNPRLRSEQTLQEYLQLQLSLVANTSDEYHVGLALINCLNAYGYLEADEHEIAAQLGVSHDLVEKMIMIMQKFDPIGIFSRNVEECLRIQLQEKNLLTPEMDQVLINIENILHNNPAALAKKCQLSVEVLQRCLSVLRQLSPRPSSGFLINIYNDNIIPDGFIQKTVDGVFVFELNVNTLPQVILNSPYYQELRGKLKKPDERQFLQAKFAHANWLMQALHQRLVTMQRVASAITDHQQEFFSKGLQGLKPLTLKAIADQLDIHESTVSRITTAKYISTPRGTYELKFFFSQSLTYISEDGEDVSVKSVQNAILNLVENELQVSPLSDEQLVAKLGEKGMLVARRTISKYRKILKIPSSQARRNYYTLGLRKA